LTPELAVQMMQQALQQQLIEVALAREERNCFQASHLEWQSSRMLISAEAVEQQRMKEQQQILIV
jgi:hypothetical protein